MSASVRELPAPVSSPREGQHSGREPGRVLAQLSAALENPDIKALEVTGDATLDLEPSSRGATSTALAPAQEQGA